MTTLDTVLAFFQGKGLSSAQAAGLAGNFQVESGFRPTAANPREGAIGLAQWEGGRRKALDSYAAQTGGSEQDLTTQLNFAWQELNTTESGALHRLLATNDPASAAAAVDQYYERSSGSARQARVDAARAIAGGHPTVTGTAGAGGSSSATAAPAGVVNALAGNWQQDVMTIALKFGFGATAAALVVVGIKESVKGSSS